MKKATKYLNATEHKQVKYCTKLQVLNIVIQLKLCNNYGGLKMISKERKWCYGDTNR